MSVDQNKIDFKAIRDAASKTAAKKSIDGTALPDKINFKAIREETLKKKEQTQSVTTPPALSGGAADPTSASPLSVPDAKGFTDNDSNTLNTLLSKHNVVDANNPFASVRKNMGLQEIPVVEKVSKRPFINEYEKASTLVNTLKQDVDKMEATQTPVFIPGAPGMTAHMAAKQPLTNEQQQKVKDLEEAQNIKKKAWRELTIEGEGEIDAIVRTDQSGNLLKKTFNRLLATNPNSQLLAAAAISSETVDKINKLPSQFVTGLNYLKGVEPVIYERVTESLAKGMPLSETQVANITAQGLDIEEERLKRDISAANKNVAPDVKRLEDMSNQLKSIKPIIDSYEQKVKQLQLTPQEIADYRDKVNEYNTLVKEAKPLEEKVSGMMGGYSKKAEELSDVRKKNLVDNEEVLRAFLSDGIAEMGDEIGKATQTGNVVRPEAQVAGFMFGHTWNYDDAEIKKYGEQYAKKNGLDPTSPQVQKAIKYLQDNEGVMVMDNSIAKAGGIRELFKGAAEPIRGVSNFVEDLGRSSNDVYVEAQSQGNVNVSEKRLKSEDTGVRGVLNEVLKGTGQFASQAGLMYATGAPLGALGKTLMGSNLGASTAGELVGALPNVGKAVMAAKNPMAVFTTSYAMAYDSNLKNALNYTSDNSLAKKAAAFNSTLEGATELFLSPLDIATGIVKKFTKGQTQDLLKIFAEKSLKDTPSKLTEYATKFIKGVLGTSKVAGAEIGEEMVTQIADFATNAYLNPNSESFKNRDLANELMTTAYQTGLTMAIPALLNGIGASRANTFSKGSLMVAAQNRQKMIDAYNQDFANGKIDQNQLNGNISLINTAAQANAELPKKIDGRSLTTNEKADYIFSRVTEAMLQNKANRVGDAAEKQILNKQIIEQQNYRAAILGNEKIEEEPVYKVDKNEVSKEQFVQAAESENSNDYEFEVTGDEEVKQRLQNTDAEIERKKDAIAAELTDDELVKQVEDKKIKGYEKTSIEELKQQSLQAPDSFKNQFGDEELTVNLIAKNSEQQIQDAIIYQQDRLSDPKIDDEGIDGVDRHIQLLEKGLEKQKQVVDNAINPVINSKGEPENISKPIELSIEPATPVSEGKGKDVVVEGSVGVGGDVENALEKELNELGQKQLTKGFNKLSEATKPEQIATAIINIEQNKNQGARLSKEQEKQLSEAKAKLKEQGYEIIDYNIVRNGENTIVQSVDYYNNERDVLTEEQANAIESKINTLEKRGEEVNVDDLPSPVSRTIKPLIKKDGKMVQAAEVNTLIFESVEQAKEAIRKSKEAGYKKPNAADKIKSKAAEQSLKETTKADQPSPTQESKLSSEGSDGVVPVFHHTKVDAKDFDFGNFQRDTNSSQFGNGLTVSTDTTPFLESRYGKPIKGEVNDADFVNVDSNKSDKQVAEDLRKQGYKLEDTYDSDLPLNENPGDASLLFKDFQKNNPNVKGVKVSNHIIAKEKVSPFYVIYDSKSFYGEGSLKGKAVEQSLKETTKTETTSNQSEIEAKKADIERRRQEELFGNITALEFETTDTKGRLRKTTIKTKVDENGFKYSFETTVDGKSSSTSAPKVSKDQIKNSSIYENLDQNSKDFIDELPDDAVIFLQSIAISNDKNSAAGLGNGNITIGYASKSEGGRVDDIALKYQPNKINAKYDAELATLETEGKSDVVVDKRSDADIEKRMAELEDSGLKFDTPETKEYNALEKEMEKRERDSVFSVPLEKVNDAVDALIKKEKEQPNGYGAFIEKRDARETKEVADRYLNAKDLTVTELKKDFSDAVRGNPTTWYADGLKMREALKEATNRGIDTEKMLAEVTKVYTDAGYDIQTAKSVVANMLKPVFEGSQKVNEKQATEIPDTKEKDNTSNEGADKKGGTAKSKIAKFKEKHIKKDDSAKPANPVIESVPKDDTEPKGQADKESVQQNPDETGQPDAVDALPVLNEAQTIEAEKKRKIEQLTVEKQQKVNEVTKPEINFDFGLSINDLVNTSAANRSEVEESKSKLASLKNIINCLWA